MTTQIRHGVFETNSSSSHSLTVGDAAHSLSFPDSMLRSGVITIRLGEFGWHWERFYKPENKASYLVTDAVAQEFDSVDHTDEISSMSGSDLRDWLVERSTRVELIVQAIEKHTGCSVEIEAGSWFYVDHQSLGLSREVPDDEEDILNFLFSESGSVTTGNDNKDPPDMIATDLGRRERTFSEPRASRGF